MHGTLVCGVTPTPEAGAAAELAGALAARLGLRLVLVHVVDPRVEGGDARARLGGWADGLGLAAEIRVVRGHRVDELARLAADEGADAIVVGGRPRGARGRQVRCTLARQLEAAQPVPVLIAPPATRARSGRRLTLAGAGR